MTSGYVSPAQPVRKASPGGRILLPLSERIRVLLVEDDADDAFLVGELLDEVHAPVELLVAPSLAAARRQLAGVDCVLLDLGLPDAQGLDGLRVLLGDASGNTAVCVLTGREDEHLGAEAVAEGAQDYLIKGQVDGVLLARALRYAVERKRADENARRLRDVELLQSESSRLERGLLPQPLMSTDKVSVRAFYRPGRHSALLGGDFYDVVQTGPDRLQLMVGDVCGHGVEEAALGVELRVAWRALVLAEVPDDAVLTALEQVLVSERHSDDIFATVATMAIDLLERSVTVRLAGHPPPLLLAGGAATPLPVRFGPVLGIFEPGLPRPPVRIEVADDAAVLMYTDGLIEGRKASSEERLDLGGLCALLAEPGAPANGPDDLPDWLMGRAEDANGGPLADDVAMLLLRWRGGQR